MLAALRFEQGALWALDQTRLPWAEEWLELRTVDEVAGAIARLAIRGAPLIGVAAAYGMALAAWNDPSEDGMIAACDTLVAARPTAVNLSWAARRVLNASLRAVPGGVADARSTIALVEAERIHEEEIAASLASARHGAGWLGAHSARRLLTHCNTGWLATPGRGSALGVIAELFDRGGVERVTACETRPLLQGARLTVYELGRLGIPHELIVDGAAAGLIARGHVDAVVLGADRIAANGDVANKVGTYAHALAAAAAGIPFVVVAPTSTIDPSCSSGDGIVIEDRGAEEVLGFAGAAGAPGGTPVRNPAFDVTPARLVTALVTERGVAAPVDGGTIAALLVAE